MKEQPLTNNILLWGDTAKAKGDRTTEKQVRCVFVKVSHPSGCWRKFFMALTCWKWQDMSVARTISTTSALSSLKTQAHKTPALSLLSPHRFKV